MVYPALLPLMRTPRLPAVDWTDAPADLNGLVRFAKRQNLVSAHVPSHFNWPLRGRFRFVVGSIWNVMAHDDTREEKWRGNWRMQWVASTLHTSSEHGLSSITSADAHTSAASSRLNWRPRADLNGLVRFAKRQNLVSARVPSHFKRSLLSLMDLITIGQSKYGRHWGQLPCLQRASVALLHSSVHEREGTAEYLLSGNCVRQHIYWLENT